LNDFIQNKKRMDIFQEGNGGTTRLPLWPCSKEGAPRAPRSSGIRTHGLHHPKMARYQAALCSVPGQLYCTLTDG
jgi:hypothetical protein